MTLREYREKHGLTSDEASRRCGILRSTWAMIESGGGCRVETAKAIIDGTNGEVALEDLLPERRQPAQPTKSGV